MRALLSVMVPSPAFLIAVPAMSTFPASAPPVRATGIPPMFTKARELEIVMVLPGAPLKEMSAPRMSTTDPPLAKRSTPLLMASVLPLARLMKSPADRR